MARHETKLLLNGESVGTVVVIDDKVVEWKMSDKEAEEMLFGDHVHGEYSIQPKEQ